MANLPVLCTSKWSNLFVHINCIFVFFVNRFQAGQSSPLENVLNFVKTKLSSEPKRGKNPVHRILFIIAESTALNSANITALPARKLQDDGVEVFLLTVGKHVTNNESTNFISKPFKTHMVRVNSYPGLPRLSKALKGKGKFFLVFDQNLLARFFAYF